MTLHAPHVHFTFQFLVTSSNRKKEPIITLSIDHFKVVCSVTWPLNESESGVDLALIETSLLFLC